MIRALILYLVFASLANGQEVLFRQVADTKTNTHVEVTSLFSHISLGGYLPVRVLVTNNQAIPHKIFLKCKDSSNYTNEITTSSNFSYLVPPGKTLSQDILVPLAAQNGNTSYGGFTVTLNGSMGEAAGNLSNVFSPSQPIVLLSESLYTPNGSALDTELNASSPTSYRGSSNEFSSKFDPKRLPTDWRAFSGFDSIMLTETDWVATPPGSKNAIVSWLRLGGQLVVFTQSQAEPSALGIPADASFGSVVIKPIGADLRLDAKETISLVKPNASSQTRLDAITNNFDGKWPIQKEFGEKSFNYILFVIILITFGILVGPINLFVFAKSGQRHRLFITTPLISAGTSVILIVLIVLQDGFGGKGSRLTLMEVRPDESQNAAFIHQEQFSRTGVMTSPAFGIDDSALIVPLPLSPSRWSRFTDDSDSRGAFNIQPTSGQLYATGDWFQSRSEQGQLVTAVVPTRGRIEAGSESGVLISTFDFPLETLIYRDAAGDWFRADGVNKGRVTTPTPVDPAKILALLNETSARFSKRNKTFLDRAKMRTDHFIAITKHAPAVATHKGIDWQTTTVITGPIAR